MTLVLGFGLSSCNETFAPNVDFGDKTYINDYSALVAQVKNLADKMNLLNKILTDNYEDLIVAINANTDAITVQSETMDADMDRILAILTEGFKALGQSVDELGNRIVIAIDSQGELIAMKIDANGKLLDATIKGKIDDLVDAINNINANLSDRFEALNVILSTGLASIEVKINADSGSLIAELGKYAVQIYAFKKIPHAPDDKIFYGDNPAIFRDKTGMRRYVLFTDSLEEARVKLKRVRYKYYDAFIVTIDDDGNVIPFELPEFVKKKK